MTEKLTLEIAMKYPNAKIGINDARFRIIAIYPELNKLKICEFANSLYSVDAYVIECKLILRPLSSLTEEEEYQLELFDNYPDIINDTGLKVATGDVKFIDTLREWNIDIDGLQKRGIAVYE